MTPAQVYARARAAVTVGNRQRRRRRRLFGYGSTDASSSIPRPITRGPGAAGPPNRRPYFGPIPPNRRLQPDFTENTGRRAITPPQRPPTGGLPPMPRTVPAKGPTTAGLPDGPVGLPNDTGINTAGQGIQTAPTAATPLVTHAATSTLSAINAASVFSSPGGGGSIT